MSHVGKGSVLLGGLFVGLLSAQGPQSPQGPTVVFEGARLITGVGPAAQENGAFVVQGGRFVSVGQKGQLAAPPGAQRVDLTGKTVIPALVNAHVHLGYDRGLTYAVENFTRDHLIAQLERYAYAGVGAVTSLGTDPGQLAFAVRAQQEAGLVGGALLLTAGRGFAPPNAGPANQAMKPAAYGVTTEVEARAGVREQVGRGVDIIKIWVDDRGGTVPKLAPALIRVIVEEAHLYNTRVIAHVYYVADARMLVELGVDGFAHLPRDLPVDEVLAATMKARNVFVLPNLAVSENGTHLTPPQWLDDPLLRELVGTPELDRLRASYTRRTPAGVERSRAIYAGMQQSMARLKAAGVLFGFGSDAGAVQDHFHAFTDHRELQLMVDAGLTPIEALVAATQSSAAILRRKERGLIDEGMRADFLVLDANPLENIANTKRISNVYLRGAAVDRAGLRKTWAGQSGGQ